MDTEIHRAHSVEQAKAALADIGLPCLVESAFALADCRSWRVRDGDSFDDICAEALRRSPTGEIRISGLSGG